MHTVCFKLKTTAYERKELARRFFALSHIHNVLVKHVRKLLIRLEHDAEYQEVLKEYRALLKKKTTPKEELVPYKERLNEIRNILWINRSWIAELYQGLWKAVSEDAVLFPGAEGSDQSLGRSE